MDAERLARRVLRAPPGVGATRLVTVDGPAGAGKTSWAASLLAHLPRAAVIHTDDLFEGWDGLNDRLAERVEAWVLTPLRARLPVHHLVYDWGRGMFGYWRVLEPPDVLILEGVGSGHSELADDATLRVWVEAPASVCGQRLRDRDGSIDGPLAKWRRREAVYFEDQRVRQRADVVIDTAVG